MDIYYISKIIKKFIPLKFNYSIWIVANVIDTIQNKEHFIQHANFTEFFSKAEFASISSAIMEQFGYVRTFFSETEFIQYVLNNFNNLNLEDIIVFNFARDGVHEGKKSLIPAFCDLYNLKYTSSNAFVISLLRNKFVYTKYLEALGIPTPQTTCTNAIDKTYFLNIKGKNQIIKNIFESASIGISKNNIINVLDYDTFINMLDSFSHNMHNPNLLIQEYIQGAECEVFVIKYAREFYAFSPVMLNINNSPIITSQISDEYDYTFLPLSRYFSLEVCNSIQRTTEKAAKLLNIKNYARFDYRINEKGEYFLIDIAGSPYLTRHSSIEYLFTKLLDLKYADIFLLIIAITLENYSHEVYCKSDNGNPREE